MELVNSCATGSLRVISVSEQVIRRACLKVAQNAFPAGNGYERREYRRFPYPKLVAIVPLHPHKLAVCGESFFVVGKHLAFCGMDFYYSQPIRYRRVLVTLEHSPEGRIHLVLNLTRCRFIAPGWYHSGGRFTKLVVWDREREPS